MGEAESLKKRRLPSWMSSSTSPSKPRSLIQEEEAPSLLVGTSKKRGQVGGRSPKAKAAKKPKPRKRLRRRHTSDDDDDDDPISVEEDADIQQKQEEEEEEELTVDDLITIAKEYVKADEAKSKQNGVTTESNSTNTLSSTSRKEKLQGVTPQPDSGEQIETTSLTSRNGSGGSTFGIEESLIVTSLGPSSNSDNIKDREQPPTEDIIYSSCTTGDPTQDMLDLFLGPLLNNPKIEAMKHETFREEIALNYGLDKPSQKEEIGNQEPALTKKKSSLRDKVTMLLD